MFGEVKSLVAEGLFRVTGKQGEGVKRYITGMRTERYTPGANRTRNKQFRRLVLCPLSYGGRVEYYTTFL